MALSLLSFSAAPPSSAFSFRSVRANALRCPLSLSKASMVLSPSSSSLSSAGAFTGLSLASSFSGMPLGTTSIGHNKLNRERNRQIQVRAGKATLGMTKRSRSRKSLARVHGFRKRMQSPGGRKILKRRRDKGRKHLCPKTHYNSGKKKIKRALFYR